MQWLIKIVDDFWQEKGTSLLRRAIMSLFCGAGLWFLVTLRSQSKNPIPMKQCLFMSAGAGVMAMLVTVMLELSSFLSSKGSIGKAASVIFVILSVVGLIALIAVGMSHMPAR